MNEQQQAFLDNLQQNLNRSTPLEQLGFEGVHAPSPQQIQNRVEEYCEGIMHCLPDSEKGEVLISRVRLAGDQAQWELKKAERPKEAEQRSREDRFKTGQNSRPFATRIFTNGYIMGPVTLVASFYGALIVDVLPQLLNSNGPVQDAITPWSEELISIGTTIYVLWRIKKYNSMTPQERAEAKVAKSQKRRQKLT